MKRVNSPQRPQRRLVARQVGLLAASLFVAGQLAVGAVAIGRDLRIAFRSAPLDVIGPELRRRIDVVEQLLPPGEPVLVLLPREDAWYASLWHRGLYPRPAFVLAGPFAPRDGRILDLRARRGVRFAVVVGPQSPEASQLSLRDQITLPPEAGKGAAVCGELAP